MTNIFKKSLIALALAGVSTGAMAATVVPDSVVNASTEWAANVSAGTAAAPLNQVTADDFVVTLGTAYTAGDLLTFTFTGTGINQASIPTTLNIMDTTNNAGTIGWISNTVNTAGNTEVVYRVTSVDTAHNTNGGKITFSGVEFAPNKLGNGISVSFAAKTSDGTAIDTAGGVARTAQLVRVGSQFASVSVGAPAALNAVIDVAKSRTQFTSGVTPVTASFTVAPSSYLVGTVPTPFVATTYGATAGDVTYTLTGDFGWMLDKNDAVDAAVVTFTDAGCTVTPAEVTATKIVAKCAAGASFAPSFTIAANNKVAIPAQGFSVTANQAYSVGPVAGVAELSRSAGTWSLNGSNVEVAYMPYASNISQVINVTNRSSQTGDVSVVAIAQDGKKYDLGVVAQSKAGTILPIAGPIKTALEAKVGAITSTQRFALQIVTNAPEAAVEVYSAYNVGSTGARLVVNTSNGGGLSK